MKFYVHMYVSIQPKYFNCNYYEVLKINTINYLYNTNAGCDEHFMSK